MTSAQAVGEPAEFTLELRLAIEQEIETLNAQGEAEVAETLRELLPEAIEEHAGREINVLDHVEPIRPEPPLPPGSVEAAEFPATSGLTTSLSHIDHASEVSVIERIALLAEFDHKFQEKLEEKLERDRPEQERLHDRLEEAKEKMDRFDVEREARDLARLEEKFERLTEKTLEKIERITEKAETKVEQAEAKVEQAVEKAETKAETKTDRSKGKSKD